MKLGGVLHGSVTFHVEGDAELVEWFEAWYPAWVRAMGMADAH